MGGGEQGESVGVEGEGIVREEDGSDGLERDIMDVDKE